MRESGSVYRLVFSHIFIILLSERISAIRNNIGFEEKHSCQNTVQGRYLLSDDSGYICDSLSLDPESRCCPRRGEKFSCHGCNLSSQCCNSYEFCVSCCQNPSNTQKEQILKIRVAKPYTARTFTSVFDFCAGRCRHNSESVVHENAYHSDFHHCFGLPSNSSGTGISGNLLRSEESKLRLNFPETGFRSVTVPSGSSTLFMQGFNSSLPEARLNGINIVVGRQGESCDLVCKSNGHSCVPNKMMVLNQCNIMQKYLGCKGGCLASVGSDQPVEVVDNAPKDLNPGACLYTKAQSMLSCDGSHQYTRRLCPCA